MRLRVGPAYWPSTLAEMWSRTRGMGTMAVRSTASAGGCARSVAGACSLKIGRLAASFLGLSVAVGGRERVVLADDLDPLAPDEQMSGVLTKGSHFVLGGEHDEAEAFVLIAVRLLFDDVGVGEGGQRRQRLQQVLVGGLGVEVGELDLELLLAGQVLLELLGLEHRFALADPAVEIEGPVDETERDGGVAEGDARVAHGPLGFVVALELAVVDDPEPSEELHDGVFFDSDGQPPHKDSRVG